MKKLLLFYLLFSQIAIANIAVNSIAHYMLTETDYEGNTGPGFFINTQEFKAVSIIMKEKLGINELNSRHHQNEVYSTIKYETEVHRRKNINKESKKISFQNKSNSIYETALDNQSPRNQTAISKTHHTINIKLNSI